MADTIYAADTNILIYLHDKLNNVKREIAQNILAANPKIPAQVVSEYLNTTKRILKLSKSELLRNVQNYFPVAKLFLYLLTHFSLLLRLLQNMIFNFLMRLLLLQP